MLNVFIFCEKCKSQTNTCDEPLLLHFSIFGMLLPVVKKIPGQCTINSDTFLIKDDFCSKEGEYFS